MMASFSLMHKRLLSATIGAGHISEAHGVYMVDGSNYTSKPEGILNQPLKDEERNRICLKCRKQFMSKNCGRRLCDKCNRENSR